MMKRVFFAAALSVAGCAALAAGETVTLKPEATDEALINPGMGLYYYQYSNRLWAYGSQEMGIIHPYWWRATFDEKRKWPWSVSQ